MASLHNYRNKTRYIVGYDMITLTIRVYAEIFALDLTKFYQHFAMTFRACVIMQTIKIYYPTFILFL